jgi:hypothetical protein
MSNTAISNFILAVVLIGAACFGYFYYKGEIRLSGNETTFVGLDQSITLKEGETVRLRGSTFEVKVTDFFNDPCTGVCIWSGVGIAFEYSHEGAKQQGINLVEAFGYRVKIEKTDNETYVTLRIDII